MKTKKVLQILQVTRQTLVRYVKEGKIRVTTLPNGFYDYNNDDVFKLSGHCNNKRKTVVYSRVSTSKQKKDLENQEKTLIDYCNSNGIKVDDSFKDISNGMDFDRKEFKRMLDEVLEYKIETIYITYKDRFSRISFDLFEKLFSEYNCKIVVLNNINDTSESEEKEIFEEIISMLHCFSMKLSSKKEKRKVELIKESLENDIE